MSAWWYAEKERRIGPVGPEEIKHLLQRGSITSGTMLWREGMDAWMPLELVDELRGLKAAVPPPLPTKLFINIQSLPMASRWPRFLA